MTAIISGEPVTQQLPSVSSDEAKSWQPRILPLGCQNLSVLQELWKTGISIRSTEGRSLNAVT